MFKSLLSETIKEHQYEYENLQRHFLETQQKTKFLLEANPNEITEDFFLSVEEFDKILKHSRKSYPEPDKVSYQLLKALAKKVEVFIRIIISCSINNSYVPCLWKDSQVTMLQKLKMTGRKEKITDELALPIALQRSVKLFLNYHPRPL